LVNPLKNCNFAAKRKNKPYGNSKNYANGRPSHWPSSHRTLRGFVTSSRRTSKPKTEHIKKGFTVFQKTIATIGSILGLITATITIMNAMDNNKNNKKEPTTTQTTVVKEIQKESPQENTTPNKDNTSTKENTSQEETPQSNKKEEQKEEKKTTTQDSSTPSSTKETTDSGNSSKTTSSENKSNQ